MLLPPYLTFGMLEDHNLNGQYFLRNLNLTLLNVDLILIREHDFFLNYTHVYLANFLLQVNQILTLGRGLYQIVFTITVIFLFKFINERFKFENFDGF